MRTNVLTLKTAKSHGVAPDMKMKVFLSPEHLTPRDERDDMRSIEIAVGSSTNVCVLSAAQAAALANFMLKELGFAITPMALDEVERTEVTVEEM